MQTANDPPKSPEKSPHLSTVFTVVVSMLAGYFINLPFDKAKRSDSEYVTKVNDHESRLNSVERTLERSDERMLNVKASVEEIKRTQLEMLDEIRRAKK